MKYFSEVLKRTFDTEKECVEAEKAHEENLKAVEEKKQALANERAARAKKVEELYKTAVEAKQVYDKELRAFLADYGSFHCTFRGVDPFFSLLDWF